MMLFLQLLVPLIPLLPLFFMSKQAGRVREFVNDRRVLREKWGDKQHDKLRIRDLLPKNIEELLKASPGIDNRIRKEFMNRYRFLWLTGGIYLIAGVAVIAWFFFQVTVVICRFGEIFTAETVSYAAGSAIASFFVLYWLFLTPLFWFMGWKKMADISKWTWDICQSCLAWIEEKAEGVFKSVCEIGASFMLLYGYIKLVDIVLNRFSIPKGNFILSLMVLMLYQYIVLDVIARMVKMVINNRIKKGKCRNLEAWGKGSVLFKRLQNSTYLTMVILYLFMTTNDEPLAEQQVLAPAIGALFMIDDYLSQKEDLKEKFQSKKYNNEM